MKITLSKTLISIALMSLAACAGGQLSTLPPTATPTTPATMTPMQRAQAGKALWEEKCRTVAGEKIYKTVENVEGILLFKVRPPRSEREWADPMWPGAAFAHELTTDGYIESFLLFEQKLIGGRGHVDSLQTSNPGYRYVDIIDEKDGQRYRYTGSNIIVGRKDINAPNVKISLGRDPNYDLNIYGWVLNKTSAPDPSPRYAVTFEDHVIPEDRALGVASSTVKVIDLMTQKVLGEMIRYVWSTPASSANPSPWLTAYKCGGEEIASTTRFFTDKVLKPLKGQ